MSKKAWIVITIETLLFMLIFSIMIHYNSTLISKLNNNISVYRDSIETVVLKNDELLASKQSLILSESQIREELNVSKNEIKELKKHLKSDLAYIAKLEANVELKDTVWMKPDTVFVNANNYITKTFNYSDDWLQMNSSLYGSDVDDLQLSIDYLNIDVPLMLGLTNNYKFWVKTDNPYVTFTNIESAVVDESSIRPKKQHWNFGIHAGIGVHYGLFGQKVDVGPYVGAGVTYNF
jgi:hypothetical protein